MLPVSQPFTYYLYRSTGHVTQLGQAEQVGQAGVKANKVHARTVLIGIYAAYLSRRQETMGYTAELLMITAVIDGAEC